MKNYLSQKNIKKFSTLRLFALLMYYFLIKIEQKLYYLSAKMIR